MSTVEPAEFNTYKQHIIKDFNNMKWKCYLVQQGRIFIKNPFYFHVISTTTPPTGLIQSLIGWMIEMLTHFLRY